MRLRSILIGEKQRDAPKKRVSGKKTGPWRLELSPVQESTRWVGTWNFSGTLVIFLGVIGKALTNSEDRSVGRINKLPELMSHGCNGPIILR